MTLLNSKMLQGVFGGKITTNSDGSKTTDDVNDCRKLYNPVTERDGYIGCVEDVSVNGSHTKKKP